MVQAPPDITALLNSNTYEEGGLAYKVHMQQSNDPLSPKTLSSNCEMVFLDA